MNLPLILAEAATQPTTSEIGNSVLIAIVGLNGLVLALQAWGMLKPNPPLNQQFADKADMASGFAEIKQLLTKQEDSSRADRRHIYNRLNRHDNALSFIAGRLERKRDDDGRQLRKILTPGDSSDE